ncbi:hypothetical protein L6452_22390 [Arctium lappa]|uniref:Uncharacterized protein n=1 Tax=Arctium lappa TaxID=4217 RepID=A0ACB9B004_ARCLA|nr:hypothetical protein L6452_22390 [Arctium lappa]
MTNQCQLTGRQCLVRSITPLSSGNAKHDPYGFVAFTRSRDMDVVQILITDVGLILPCVRLRGSQFALRSYLYILFHYLVGWPAWCYNWLEEEKVRVFYAVRIFLGLLSVMTEAALVVALSRKYGKRLALYMLAMLCLTSGCFFASTSE